MKRFTKGLSFVAAGCVAFMCGCASETPWGGASGEDGKISLNLTADGTVYRSTRADDGLSPVVPAPEQFAVDLKSTDGSYSKHWDSLQKFNKEDGFPMGTYTLSASYGSIDEEGFSNPCFKGEAKDVRVAVGDETSATVTATLANAMVSVRYTDKFSNAFQQYSATVKSEGHQAHVFAQSESRPVYVAPSRIDLTVTMTNSQGKQITVNPASFDAQARRHYVVTFDVEGDVALGNSSLTVKFEEEVVSETREIILSDDLFNSPAPWATANEAAKNGVEGFEAVSLDASVSPEFHIFAFGGIESARLTVTPSDGGVAPVFGSEVELANADATVQAQLKSAGVDCAGLFNKVGEMAVVNFRDFTKNLNPGTYTVSLNVTDKAGRVLAADEIPSMTAKVSKVEYQVAASSVKPSFWGNTVEMIVNTNCPGLKDEMKFQVDGKAANVKAVATPSAGASTRADYPCQFVYTLSVDRIEDSLVKVKGYYGSKEGQTVDVAVAMPEFTVETDALAKKARLRIGYEDEAIRKAIVENISVYKGNTQLTGSAVKTDSSTGIIEITGLNPATAYSDYSLTIGTSKERDNHPVASFTTEAATDVPNGRFTSLRETINLQKLSAGGKYQYGATKMQNWCDLNVSEPDGWASINAKTCYLGSDPQNTWFMVPSTLAESGKVMVRSVAYDHNGTLPDLDNHVLAVRKKYSRNAPKSFASKSAGELFLGSYSFDGTEHRQDGIPFKTRPASMTFSYSYLPVSGESAEAVIKVLDASGAVIAEKTEIFNTGNSNEKTLVLPEYGFGKKAEKLIICFKSTSGDDISAPVPTDLADVSNTTNLLNGGQKVENNVYKSLCVGSVLTITSVKLNY